MFGNYKINVNDAESSKNTSRKNLENFASIIPLTGRDAGNQDKPEGLNSFLNMLSSSLNNADQAKDANGEQLNNALTEGFSKLVEKGGMFDNILSTLGGADGIQDITKDLTQNMGDFFSFDSLGAMSNGSSPLMLLPQKVQQRVDEMKSVASTSTFQIDGEIPNIMNLMIEGAGSSDSLVPFSKFLTEFVAKNNSSKEVGVIWRDLTNTHMPKENKSLMPVYLDSVSAIGNGISLRTPYGMIDFTIGPNEEISMKVNSSQESMSNAASYPNCTQMFEPGKLLPVQHLVFKEGQLGKRIKEICDEFRQHEGDMITEAKEKALEKVLSLQTISQKDLTTTHKKDNPLREIYYYMNAKEDKLKVENFFRTLFKSDKWSEDSTMNINEFLDLVKEKNLEIFNALEKIKNVKVLKNINLKDLKLKLRVLDPATQNRMEVYKVDSVITLQPPKATNANGDFDMVYNIFEEDNIRYNYISSVKKPQTAVCGAYLNRTEKSIFDLQASNKEFESTTRKSIETITEHIKPFKHYLERIYRNTLKGMLEQADKDIKASVALIRKMYADHRKFSVIDQLCKYILNYVSTGKSEMKITEPMKLFTELSDSASFAAFMEDPIVIDLIAHLAIYLSIVKIEIPELDDLGVCIDEIQFVDNEIVCMNGRLLGIDFNPKSMFGSDSFEGMINNFLDSNRSLSFTGGFSIHFDKQGGERDREKHINDNNMKVNEKKSFSLKIHDYIPLKMQTPNNTKIFGLIQTNNQNFHELVEKEESKFQALNQKLMNDYHTGIKKMKLNKLRIQDLDEDGNMIMRPRDDGETFDTFKATNFAINSLKFKTNELDGRCNLDEVNFIGLSNLEPTSSNVICKMAINEAREGKINYFTV